MEKPILKTAGFARAETPPMWLRPSYALPVHGDEDMPIIGEVRMFAGAVPAKWLPLGSGPVSRTTYSELFGEIGTTWGPGDGSTTFDLPPSNRFPIAAGSAAGMEPHVLGDTSDTEEITLTEGQSGIPDGVVCTVIDPGHLHDEGSLSDTGHLHDLTGAAASVNDPNHRHSPGSDAFVTNGPGSEYVNTGGDKGTIQSDTDFQPTGITVDLTGNTGSGNANISGNVGTSGTGISVTTIGQDALNPVAILPAFACFNFAIFANA